MNRRDFVKVGVLGTLAPSVLQAVEEKKNEKKCIYIYLGGGISHIEFLNPIPEAGVEFRSTTGSVKTKSGYDIGGSFTNLAQCSDLFTSVRSLSHRDANHYTAQHWINTGKAGNSIPENGPSLEPFYGTIVNHKYGSNTSTGMPNFVKTNKMSHDGPAWLGSKYMGYDNDSEATKNLKLENRDRFLYKTKMLKEINKQSFKAGNNSHIFKAFDETRDSALEIIVGDISIAFNLDLEDENSKLKYKIASSELGKNLLMARRLIENGSKFVTVETGSWDNHSDIKDNFDSNGIELDYMLATLLKDLKERGLLEDTLVVVCSEFGRTYRLNQSGGRDHMSSCNSLLLAGGKNYGGILLGSTDNKASLVIDNPFSPDDLCWTILNHFDIDKSLTILDGQKRPRHIIDKEAKLIL